MSDTVSFRGRITPELFLKAQKLHAANRRWVALVAGVAILAGLLTVSTWERYRTTGLTVISCGAGVLIAFAIRRFHIRRIYDQTPHLRNEFRGEVSQDTYTVEGAFGSVKLPWAEFTKVKTSDETVLLYRGPSQFNIIAKEFFNSQEDWLTAKSIAEEKVNSASKKRLLSADP